MVRFEDLSGNVRALILAKLSMGMSAQKASSIHLLARMRGIDVMGVWRGICLKAGQPVCTLPIEVAASHSSEIVRNP